MYDNITLLNTEKSGADGFDKTMENLYKWKEYIYFNPFPHIDAFWRLCSRRLFENIVTKEEIAQNVQFLLLSQCFHF